MLMYMLDTDICIFNVLHRAQLQDIARLGRSVSSTVKWTF
jgi:hypothetical protein